MNRSPPRDVKDLSRCHKLFVSKMKKAKTEEGGKIPMMRKQVCEAEVLRFMHAKVSELC